MSAEEIEFTLRLLRKFGVRGVKITGGEPMLRSDIVEIVRRIKGLGYEDISMVTNGTRFHRYAKELREAGLNRVNISVHSLNPETYRYITGGVGDYDGMLRAIDAALTLGITPLKLNVVVLKGINDGEIDDLIRYVAKLNEKGEVILQLIELVNAGNATSDFFERHYFDLSGIEGRLREHALRVEVKEMHRRRKYYLSNGAVVEVVKPTHNSEFCMGCTRLRITHDGKFKPCLLRDDNLVDFINIIRRGGGEEGVEEALRKAVSLREPYFKG